jgi:hypothetical protein
MLKAIIFMKDRRFSVSNRLTFFLARVISCTLKMEVSRSSETSVYNKPTWPHVPEDSIVHLGMYSTQDPDNMTPCLRMIVERLAR